MSSDLEACAYLCVCLEHAPVQIVGNFPAVLHLRYHVLEGRPTVQVGLRNKRRGGNLEPLSGLLTPHHRRSI